MSNRFLASINVLGHVVPKSPERLMKRAGEAVWVSIHDQPTIGLRSDDQNRFLWGVVYKAISLETGNDPDSIHYGLKRKAIELGILDPEYIVLGDRIIEAEPTTRTDSDTFSRYIDWIRQSAEHGDLTGIAFHIPEANEA